MVRAVITSTAMVSASEKADWHLVDPERKSGEFTGKSFGLLSLLRRQFVLFRFANIVYLVKFTFISLFGSLSTGLWILKAHRIQFNTPS